MFYLKDPISGDIFFFLLNSAVTFFCTNKDVYFLYPNHMDQSTLEPARTMGRFSWLMWVFRTLKKYLAILSGVYSPLKMAPTCV